MQNNSQTRLSEYTIAEELANSITHGFGALISIVGFILLYIQASTYGTDIHVISYSIFSVSLIALYLASTLYHAYSNTRFHKILKKIDHLTIYFLIAGTYSPLMLVGIESNNGWIMLEIIWSLAIFSCILKFSKNRLLQKIAFINYLLMGWLVIIVFDELIVGIPLISIYLLVVGGVLYTTGVIFYLWDSLPFNHSIWHGFVLGGSVSHYFSIYNII
jgi:hemolysin III